MGQDNASISGATNTQKTVMLSLAEGWRLRHVEGHGWCLFQEGRERPFARVKERTVATLTDRGWLTTDDSPKGLGFRPAKELTPLGWKYIRKLVDSGWAGQLTWDPFDARARKASDTDFWTKDRQDRPNDETGELRLAA